MAQGTAPWSHLTVRPDQLFDDSNLCSDMRTHTQTPTPRPAPLNATSEYSSIENSTTAYSTSSVGAECDTERDSTADTASQSGLSYSGFSSSSIAISIDSSLSQSLSQSSQSDAPSASPTSSRPRNSSPRTKHPKHIISMAPPSSSTAPSDPGFTEGGSSLDAYSVATPPPTAPYSTEPPNACTYQCPLRHLLPCDVELHLRDQWETHVASHFFNCGETPKAPKCPGCGVEKTWDEMMACIAEHFEKGHRFDEAKKANEYVDMKLFNWLGKKRVMSSIRWQAWDVALDEMNEGPMEATTFSEGLAGDRRRRTDRSSRERRRRTQG